MRLLVDLQRTWARPDDDSRWPIHTFEVPMEAVEEVYVGFDTPREQVRRIISRIVDVGQGTWRLRHTHWHAYRLQVTSTFVNNRKPPRGTDGGGVGTGSRGRASRGGVVG